jgi:hypothetical protein
MVLREQGFNAYHEVAIPLGVLYKEIIISERLWDYEESKTPHMGVL